MALQRLPDKQKAGIEGSSLGEPRSNKIGSHQVNLILDNDDRAVAQGRHYSDDILKQETEAAKMERANLRKKVQTSSDWYVAEGLLSVFMKQGSQEVNRIVWRKAYSE